MWAGQAPKNEIDIALSASEELMRITLFVEVLAVIAIAVILLLVAAWVI
jgi:hypothetical protein